MLTSWIRGNFDQNGFQFTWRSFDTLRICYSVNGQSTANHLLAKTALCSKLSNFLLDFRPPGKTKERKHEPRNVRIPGGRPGDGQAWN